MAAGPRDLRMASRPTPGAGTKPWSCYPRPVGLERASLLMAGSLCALAFSVDGAWSKPLAEPGPLPVGAEAPRFRLRTFGNRLVKLESLLGQPVLVDFYRADCFPCRRMLPDLIQIHEDYAQAGLQVVLIGLLDGEAGGEARLTQSLTQYRLPFLVLKDPTEYYSQKFLGPSGSLPAAFLLDGDGRVLHRQVGAKGDTPFADFERVLKARGFQPAQTKSARP